MKRKDNMQQQRARWNQGNLFVPAPQPAEGSGTALRDARKAELFSELERKRTLTTNIMAEIAEYGNLSRAYLQVTRNGGSPGIDGMTTEDLQTWLGVEIEGLRQTLTTGTWYPAVVKKVTIPKPGGGERLLGIPTVRDRLVQQAIHQVLERYFDSSFSEYSYGFRPRRSAHQAIIQASGYVAEGREWVVEIDLEKFFDQINHDRLMQRLSKGIGDKRLLQLIHSFLRTGLMSDGIVEQRTSGTPQGGPLSPLLSNIVLDELDRELEARGHKFCRYADDCNIYVSSEAAGQRVMESITNFIEKKLKLKVNRAKSGVRHCSAVKFLGYTILKGGDLRVSEAATQRLKDKIREATKRSRGVRFETVVEELNRTIIGWCKYFKLANRWLNMFKDMDGWMRRKLRCYKLKQCGRTYTVVKMLVGLGATSRKAWNVACYSQGWWSMSNKPTTSQVMNPRWFAQQGLRSIHDEIRR